MSEIVAVPSVGGASRLVSSGAGAAPTAPLQGTPGLEGPDDHVPHSGTPQKPDFGHGVPCTNTFNPFLKSISAPFQSGILLDNSDRIG